MCGSGTLDLIAKEALKPSSSTGATSSSEGWVQSEISSTMRCARAFALRLEGELLGPPSFPHSGREHALVFEIIEGWITPSEVESLRTPNSTNSPKCGRS